MSRWFGETDLGDNLIRLQRSLHQIHKEIVSLDRTHTTRSFRHNISLQRQYHTRRISGRVRVRNTTANSTHVAYLLIANERYSPWQQSDTLLDKAITRTIHIPPHRD